MRKNYFIKTSLTLFLLLGTMLVNAQIAFSLQEGFEDGIIPATWTQEHVVGNQSWVVERGGTFPNGAAEGNYRIALRNTTQQTQGFVTKLITPVMDLSEVFHPILVFSYAQNHNLGDVDELRVFYRRGENEPWIMLREYTVRVPFWQSDTIRLPAQNATYQIAFEGTDRFGRGIVLDDIRVRPLPMCDQPRITVASDVTSTSFRIHWLASFDSDAFHVRVSTTPLVDVENAAAAQLVVDTIIPGSPFTHYFENLEVNTYYYIYIKAVCSAEESEWSDVFIFRTQAIAHLPYHQDFHMEHSPGFTVRTPTWTYGTSWSPTAGSIGPFVNTASSLSARLDFSRNGSLVLVFARNNNTGTTGRIPAGEWVYAASPQIIVDDMSQVQVSFWATAHTHVGATLASSIIVGIMTDPTDITTFVPIDTAVITASSQFREFIVPFDQYTGSGRHVAFMSLFDRQNIFYIDEVTIDFISECQKILEQNVQITHIRYNSADFMWRAISGAQSYEAVVSPVSLADPSLADDSLWIRGIPENSVTITGLDATTNYFFYLRSNCGGTSRGEWSSEIRFRTIEPPCAPLDSFPFFYGFEVEGGLFPIPGFAVNDLNRLPYCVIQSTGGTTPIRANNTNAANPSTRVARTGDRALTVTGTAANQAYVAFPPVPDEIDFRNVRIAFWARTGTQLNIDNGQNGIEIGVMTDARNRNTFVPIDTIFATTFTAAPATQPWLRYTSYFSRYTGNGRIIAIRPMPTASATTVHIDDLWIELVPECSFPIVGVTPGDTTALFSWEATGATRYQIRIASTISNNNIEEAVIDTIVATNSFLATGLTPNVITYFYQVRALCGEHDVSEWSRVASFRTLCIPATSVPFFEGFDGQGYPIGTAIDLAVHSDAPPCWSFLTASRAPNLGSAVTTPHLSTQNIFVTNPLVLTMVSSGVLEPQMAVLPRFDVPLQELYLSFLVAHGEHSEDPAMEVGVIIGDDFESFELIELIGGLPRNVVREIVINFSEFEGAGNRIAFRRAAATRGTMHIDNITVDRHTCIRPHSPLAINVTDTQARLIWTPGNDETRWELFVVQTDGSPDPETVTANIVFRDTISGTPAHTLYNLIENTPYVFFVRSICGESVTAWTALSRFRTGCEPVTVGEFGINGTYSFDHYTASSWVGRCWQVGRLIGSQTSALPVPGTPTGSGNRRRLHIIDNAGHDGSFAIAPPIDIDSISRLRMTFNFATNSTGATNVGGIIVGVITNPADMASFVPVDTVLLRRPLTTNVFEDYEVTFAGYQGDPNGEFGTRVMFLSMFGVDGVTNNVFITDVRFDTITVCDAPVRITTSSITHNQATIDWIGYEDGEYKIVVSSERLSVDSLMSPALAQNPAVHTASLLTGTSYTVTGLEMLTTYFVYIRAICRDGEGGGEGNIMDSNWSLEHQFATVCPPTNSLPWFENFDDYGTETTVLTSARLPCWGRFNSGSATILAPQLQGGQYNHTPGGVAGLRFNLTGNIVDHYIMAISPPLDVEDMSKTTLTFFARNENVTSRPKLIVGVTAHPDSLTLTSFTPIDTICIARDFGGVSADWFRYTFDLASLASSENVLAYRHLVFAMERRLNEDNADPPVAGAPGAITIDDIELEMTPTCGRPVGLAHGNVGSLTAEIFWTMDEENFDGLSWEVQFGYTGFELGTGTIVPVDTNFVVIEGFTPDQEHEIYVRTVCGNGNYSRWTRPITLTTLCLLDASENIFFGFEIAEGRAASGSQWLPLCWFVGTDPPTALANSRPRIQYNQTTGTANVWAKRGGTGALEFQVTSSFRHHFAAMPEMIGDMDTLQVNFSARAVLTGALDNTDVNRRGRVTVNSTDGGRVPHVMVGTMTDPTDWNTFELISTVFLSRWTNTDVESTANNYLWDDISVPLYGAQGKYVTLAVGFVEGGSPSQAVQAFVDDVSISKVTCAIPDANSIRFVNFNDEVTSADLTWNAIGASFVNASWEVLVENMDAGTTVFSQIVDTIGVAGISILPQTNYQISIRAICDNDESRWSVVVTRTGCSPSEVEYVWDMATTPFRPNVSAGTNLNSFTAPECWIVGNKNAPNVQANIPHIIRDGASTTVTATVGPSIAGTTANRFVSRNHTFGGGAVMRFNTTVANNGGYAILPAVYGDLDTLQVRFFARGGILQNTSVIEGFPAQNVFAGSALSIIVGTVTDRNDISTFVPIDTARVRRLSNSGDNRDFGTPENNMLWEEFIVSLGTATGRYVTFLSEFPQANEILVDGIIIEPFGGCMLPRNLSISERTSTSARLSFERQGATGLSWTAVVAEVSNPDSVVFQATVNAFQPIDLTGLTPGVEHVAVVQQRCGVEEDDVSEFSRPLTFWTAYELPYRYDFSVARHEPIAWTRHVAWFVDGMSTPGLTPATQISPTLAWVHSNTGIGILGPHQRTTLRGSRSAWLVTPLIELPADAAWLTFDAALTAENSALPVPNVPDGEGDKLKVIVSNDGGLTWRSENATVWANDGTGDYVFDEIPATGKQFFVDLSKHAGKQVRIAFYIESRGGTSQSGNWNPALTRHADLRIGNVNVNRVVRQSYLEALCFGHDFFERGFFIEYDNFELGDNDFTRISLSPRNGSEVDSLISLTVNVSQMAETTIHASICEGEIFTGYDFFADRAGVFRRKLESHLGCDSVVVLNLSMFETIRIEMVDTICQGQSIWFGGEELNRSGVYYHTFTSVVTDCDSIVTLFLTVRDALRTTFYETVCFGESFTWNGNVFTESGIFEELFRTAEGCDSIVTLNLTVRDEIRPTVIRAFTCPYVPFTGYGFEGIPYVSGDYHLPLRTPEGCDSLVILRLLVLNAGVMFVTETITENDLPFTFYGGRTLPVGTPLGVYSDTITVTGFTGECQSMLITTVIIEQESGLQTVTVDGLTVVPTIIGRGEFVEIIAPNDMGDLIVEVYDMQGQRIYWQQAQPIPIRIDAFPVSGIYVIRAISENGIVMQSRVIVR